MKKRYQVKRKEPIFTDELTRQNAYKKLFETELGRRVLDDFYEAMGFNRTSHCKDSESQTSFNEGKKHACWHFKHILTIKLEQVR